jgi:hypothetical protein
MYVCEIYFSWLVLYRIELSLFAVTLFYNDMFYIWRLHLVGILQNVKWMNEWNYRWNDTVRGKPKHAEKNLS